MRIYRQIKYYLYEILSSTSEAAYYHTYDTVPHFSCFTFIIMSLKPGEKKWFPLESNDLVMNKYIEGMGVDTSKVQFNEVLSMEDWALDMVPQPVHGVVMLYPIKDVQEEFRKQQEKRIATEGQIISPNVKYIKQTIGNACGTIGILHALSNCDTSVLGLPSGDSYIKKFLSSTSGMSPDEVAQYLNEDDGLEATHEVAASEGQTAQVDINEPVNNHFVCFSHVDGHLYELDGRKNGPINHGKTAPSTLLADACAVVREYMARDPDEVRFTIVALSAPAT